MMDNYMENSAIMTLYHFQSILQASLVPHF